MAEVTINSTLFNVNHQGNNSPSSVFISGRIGYAFFVSSAENLVYSKTTDGGATWGAAVNVAADGDERGYAIWYDRWTKNDAGTKIHIAYGRNGNQQVYYRNLDTATDTVSSAVGVTGDLGLTGFDYTYPSICKSNVGYLFISAGGTGASRVEDIWKSTNGGANWASTGVTFLDTIDECCLMPMETADGDIMAVVLDNSATDLLSFIYDETTDTWSGATTIDGTFNKTNTDRYRRAWGMARDPRNGDIYVAGDNDPNTAGGDLKVYKYVSSWTTMTDVYTNIGADGAMAKIAIACTGTIYVIYSRGAAGAESVYYKVSTDGASTWGVETLLSATADTITIVKIGQNDNRIYGIWYNTDLDDLLGNTIVVPPLCVYKYDSVTIAEYRKLAMFIFVNVFDNITISDVASWRIAYVVFVFDNISIASIAISVQVGYFTFTPGEYTFRYNRFRIILDVADPDIPVFLDDLVKRIDAFDVSERGKDVNVTAPGGATVTFSQEFGDTPAITVTTHGSSPYKPVVTLKSATQFTVKLYDLNDVEVSGVIDYIARGWWITP